MGDYVERKGTMASQIPKSVHWRYEDNFKLMVIKHAEETNNCAAARKFGVTELNVQHWRKQKEQIQPEKNFMGPSMGISMLLTRKFWSLC
jgi:hypothetical protein